MFWERFYDMVLQTGTKPNPFAKELGISSAVLTNWKKGDSIPNGETLRIIADKLDCSVDYLLGRTDDPQAHKRRKLGKMVIDLDAIAVPLIQPANSLDVEELA